MPHNFGRHTAMFEGIILLPSSRQKCELVLFYPQDGGSTFLQNTGDCYQTAQKAVTSLSLPWELHRVNYCLLTSTTTLSPRLAMLMMVCLSCGEICACWTNFVRFSSLMPFFEIMYRAIMRILSVADTAWSSKIGTMFRIWSLILSPSASVPIAKSCVTPTAYQINSVSVSVKNVVGLLLHQCVQRYYHNLISTVLKFDMFQ